MIDTRGRRLAPPTGARGPLIGCRRASERTRDGMACPRADAARTACRIKRRNAYLYRQKNEVVASERLSRYQLETLREMATEHHRGGVSAAQVRKVSVVELSCVGRFEPTVTGFSMLLLNFVFDNSTDVRDTTCLCCCCIGGY